MSKYVGSRRSRLLLPILALALGAVAFMTVGSATAGSKACGTVTLNEQAWAGSTANTYVAKYVLEHKLGCKVNITQIAEIPVYQAMADGKTDAVLEDWQHVDQYKQYITKQHTSVLEGSNGVNGHIFWAIPDYLMKQYPQFKTWKGLKGKESIFKSPESGSQGMFLGGDPSYVQKDQQLIKALGLNFKFVSVGAEAAQVARWTQLVQAEEAGALLLVHAAVPERAVPARRGAAAEALQGLQGRRARQGQRQSQPVQVRLQHVPAEQGVQHEVRQERLARGEVPEEVGLVERRPEHGRRPGSPGST